MSEDLYGKPKYLAGFIFTLLGLNGPPGRVLTHKLAISLGVVETVKLNAGGDLSQLCHGCVTQGRLLPAVSQSLYQLSPRKDEGKFLAWHSLWLHAAFCHSTAKAKGTDL